MVSFFQGNVHIQRDIGLWKDFDLNGPIEDAYTEMARMEELDEWTQKLSSTAECFPFTFHRSALVEGTIEDGEGDHRVAISVLRHEVADRRQEEGHSAINHTSWSQSRVVTGTIVANGQTINRNPSLIRNTKGDPIAIVWITSRRQEPASIDTPPRENIENGASCEKCRSFSYEDGQKWVNATTHKFLEGMDGKMNDDILKIVAATHNVEVPESSAVWGVCTLRQRLISRHFPGCAEYAARKVWK
jgi:hypothetical protein